MQGVLQNLHHKIQTADVDDENDRNQLIKDYAYQNQFHEKKEMENKKRQSMTKTIAKNNKETMSERKAWDLDFQDERLNDKIGLTKEQIQMKM